MPYFSVNFFHRTAIKIQYRVLTIPWLERNCVVFCCGKGRCYSNSPLARYIPRKSVKNEGRVLSVGRLEFSNESVGGFLDVDSVGDDECLSSDVNRGLNLAVEEKLKGNFTAVTDDIIGEPNKAVEDNSIRCCGIPSGSSWQDVENSAVKLLASRAFTSMELKKKLQGKSFQHETIDAVITDFKSRGLINDCLYAEAYTRSRWSSSSWGPLRIRQALFKKGISEADAEKAIKLVFENHEGDEDQDPGIAMSKLSIDQLYVQASKQWQRSHGASQEVRKSRIIRWLQYRGFNWGVIKYILKKLESGSPWKSHHCTAACPQAR